MPPDVALLVHPDWRANETAYRAQRDSLLGQFRDQWIAFADGTVIASGTRPVGVFQAAKQSGRHPFVIRVGREQEPFRMRHVSFPYDSTCTQPPGRPLPRTRG